MKLLTPLISYHLSYEAVSASYISLLCFLTIFLSNLPYTFIWRTWSSNINVPVEVSSSVGNFDTPWKFSWETLWNSKSEFWFWHSTDLDFIRPVDFLKGGHLKKFGVKKYFSWKPCRSYEHCWYVLNFRNRFRFSLFFKSKSTYTRSNLHVTACEMLFGCRQRNGKDTLEYWPCSPCVI